MMTNASLTQSETNQLRAANGELLDEIATS